jgi:hypothetical protein
VIEKSGVRFRRESTTGEGMHFNYDVIPHAQKIGVGLRRVYTYRLDNAQSATKKANIQKQGIGAVENMEHIQKTITLKTKELFKNNLYFFITLASDSNSGSHYVVQLNFEQFLKGWKQPWSISCGHRLCTPYLTC